METPIDGIRSKISTLESQIGDLRIAERELLALDKQAARPAKSAPAAAVKTPASAKAKPAPQAKAKPAAASKGSSPASNRKPKAAGASSAPEGAAGKESVASLVANALADNGPLTVAEIVEVIASKGREVNNRAISFTLQALKKRSLAASIDGKWAKTAANSRSKSPKAASNSGQQPAAA